MTRVRHDAQQGCTQWRTSSARSAHKRATQLRAPLEPPHPAWRLVDTLSDARSAPAPRATNRTQTPPTRLERAESARADVSTRTHGRPGDDLALCSPGRSCLHASSRGASMCTQLRPVHPRG